MTDVKFKVGDEVTWRDGCGNSGQGVIERIAACPRRREERAWLHGDLDSHGLHRLTLVEPPRRATAPKRASALQKLRGAQRLLAIAIEHVERAHEGDAHKRRGVREQAASAIGHAGTLVAEAGALFAIEVLRAGGES